MTNNDHRELVVCTDCGKPRVGVLQSDGNVLPMTPNQQCTCGGTTFEVVDRESTKPTAE